MFDLYTQTNGGCVVVMTLAEYAAPGFDGWVGTCDWVAGTHTKGDSGPVPRRSYVSTVSLGACAQGTRTKNSNAQG